MGDFLRTVATAPSHVARRLVVGCSALFIAFPHSATAQPAGDAPMTAGQAFDNVQVLGDLPVDDFMATMGIMAAALGFDCANCHIRAGTPQVDWVADPPPKRTARRMVNLVAAINRDHFGGRQVVTCWTCHRGRSRPLVTPPLDRVYGEVTFEPDDIVLTSTPGLPEPETLINRYLEALGDPERLQAVTSLVATGTSLGFRGFGGGATVEIYSQRPDQRSTIMRFEAAGRESSVRSFDGEVGWIRTPETVLGEYRLSGSELKGARLDAQLAFPDQLPNVLTNLRTLESELIDDQLLDVVQGNGPDGLFVTLYFDAETGLLRRLIRYGSSPIGRLPTQIEYDEYRDVDGVQMPFGIAFIWLDGRDTIQLEEIQLNVPIDEAMFDRPTSFDVQ